MTRLTVSGLFSKKESDDAEMPKAPRSEKDTVFYQDDDGMANKWTKTVFNKNLDTSKLALYIGIVTGLV